MWFSGTLHRRNVARIVELGDGWIPIIGASIEDIRAGVGTLRTAFVDAGRDPDSLRVQAPARTLDVIPALADAGATTISRFYT